MTGQVPRHSKRQPRSILLVVLPYRLGDATTDTTKKAVRSFLAFPYGVLTLASYLKRYASNLGAVEVLDLNLPSSDSADILLARKLADMRPDIVGFSMSYDVSYPWLKSLAKSVKDAFYPFVQNSQWFDDKNTILAPLFRSLAPALCKSCDPVDPYDNPWLKNYSVKPAAAVDLPEVTGTHHSAQTPVADAVTAIPARARAATTVRQSASRGRSGKPGSASAR